MNRRRKRIFSADPTFNAIQELIYQYMRYRRQCIKNDFPVTLDGFIRYLIGEGWSYDYSEKKVV